MTLVALEHGGYIALPTDYSRPNAAWDTLDDIENRGVPEHMALLLAQNGPKPTRKRAMRKFWPAYEKLGGQKQKLLDCVNGQLLLLVGRGELAQSQTDRLSDPRIRTVGLLSLGWGALGVSTPNDSQS